MVEAAIALPDEFEVAQITSRMIAERSGTATNYTSRSLDGRDALLATTAEELGRRTACETEDLDERPESDEPLALLEAVVSISEVRLWFQLFRYLSARSPTEVRESDSKPPLVAACEDGEKVLAKLDRIVEMLRDNQISLGGWVGWPAGASTPGGRAVTTPGAAPSGRPTRSGRTTGTSSWSPSPTPAGDRPPVWARPAPRSTGTS